MSMGTDPGTRDAGRSALKGPGIGLLVVGALGVLGSGAGLAFSRLVVEVLSKDQKLPEDQRKFIEMVYGTWSGVFNGIGILLALLAVAGALAMLNAKARGLAWAGIIAAMLPGCCCVVGIPIGIWAIITLMKPEVQAAFE